MSDARRYALVAVALIVIVATTFALRPGSTPPIEGPNAISSLEAVEIGGVEQWLLIRGRDTHNPVLLFVHGGPGMASMPTARQFSDAIEEEFVVVHWDQRGAGKSCSSDVPPESLNVDRYVADLLEVADHLRERFGDEKIFLLGHSWGSVIGAIAAEQAPERFHAYVGMGQVVDMTRGEEISHAWVVERATEDGNEQALRDLETARPPYDRPQDLVAHRRWLGHYGGDVLTRDAMARGIQAVFTAQEYTLNDRFGFYFCLLETLDRVWTTFDDLNFIERIPAFELPVRFFLGRHDYNVPSILVEEWMQTLQAPSRDIVWFEESAHLPNIEEPARFQRELIALKSLAR